MSYNFLVIFRNLYLFSVYFANIETKRSPYPKEHAVDPVEHDAIDLRIFAFNYFYFLLYESYSKRGFEVGEMRILI